MSIEISNPWARVQTPESGEAGGFLTLVNSGPEPDRLIAAESAVAASVEIHGIKVVGPDLRMRPMERGISLPVQMPIELKPRGYHLLFKHLNKPLAPGDTVKVTLIFEKAARREIELVVKEPGLVGADVLGVWVPAEAQPGFVTSLED